MHTFGAQTLFKYRTRMANYGENFRGMRDPVTCGLCKTHLENQKMCFENCPVLKGTIPIQIVCASVPSSQVNTLLNIDKFRKEANY